MATSRICSIPDCDKPALSRGWCSMHYQRWKKHRDPMALKYPSHARDFYERTVLTYDKDDCLFWPYAKNPQGYGLVAHEGRQRSVHLIACIEVNGPSPFPGYQAAHECGNRHLGCVNPRHIRWKSVADNMADKVRHGTAQRGEKSTAAKLTESDVRKIRALRGKLPQHKIAAHFNIGQMEVSRIQRKLRWEWLD